ncbi:putative molybdenum carrier protein [Massilia niastensis]|uniref:putative molybdenum carrier protein n=1 Tax=Massilia niastensis TaxID=544911 RepID=UPI0009FE7B0E|nr:putative molybdenum carrier protein [Massilia niastensis]
MRSIRKIVSGGQTGADLAAWDVAREFAIPFGGYVPAGRTNENGRIPSEYESLQETASSETVERTKRNVEVSDATLIICRNEPVGGTLTTLEHCKNTRKPAFVADLARGITDDWVRCIGLWLDEMKPNILNVAGPRHSEDPEIYSLTRELLCRVMKDRTVSRNDLNDLLRYVHSDIKSDFRHWDVIRWQIPSWYVALLIGGLALAPGPIKDAPWAAFLVIGVFGLLCNLLAFRTAQYHSDQMKRFHNLCVEIEADELVERELSAKLPFSLERPGIFFTATFWFHIFVFITAVGCLWLAVLRYVTNGAAR